MLGLDRVRLVVHLALLVDSLVLLPASVLLRLVTSRLLDSVLVEVSLRHPPVTRGGKW